MANDATSHYCLGDASIEVTRKYEDFLFALKGDFATVINFIISRRPLKFDPRKLPKGGGRTVRWTVSASRRELETSLEVLDNLMKHYKQKSRCATLSCLLMSSGISFYEDSVTFDTELSAKELAHNFNEKRKKNMFYDLEIVIGEHTHLAHKILMTSSSKYFDNNSDLKSSCINISYVVENSAFELALEFMYTGKIVLNKESINLVKDCASFLGIEDLLAVIKTYDDLSTFNKLSKAQVVIGKGKLMQASMIEKSSLQSTSSKKKENRRRSRSRKKVNYVKLAGMGMRKPNQEMHTESSSQADSDSENVCDKCNKPFQTLLGLVRHKATVCDPVRKIPPGKHKLVKQEQAFDDDDSSGLKCDVCNKSFNNSLAYTQHVNTVCKKTAFEAHKFQCEVCRKPFDNSLAFTQHTNTICKKRIQLTPLARARAEGKKQHSSNMAEDSGQDNEESEELKCDFCNQKFRYALALAKHSNQCEQNITRLFPGHPYEQDYGEMDQEQNISIYKCNQCATPFVSALALAQHTKMSSCDQATPVSKNSSQPLRDTEENDNSSAVDASDLRCSFCGEQFVFVLALAQHKRKCLKRREEISQVMQKSNVIGTPTLSTLETALAHGNVLKTPTNKGIRIPCDSDLGTDNNELSVLGSPSGDQLRIPCDEEMGTPSGSYTCDLCNEEFQTMLSMMQHKKGLCAPSQRRATEKIISIKKEFLGQNQCEICGKVFEFLLAYKKHISSCTKPDPFYCDMCPLSFDSKDELLQHFIEHETFSNDIEQTDDLNLTEMSKSSHQKSEISSPPAAKRRRRIKASPKSQRVECKECGQSIGNKRSLRVHMLKHKVCRTEEFSCTTCDAKFPLKSKLEEHCRLEHGGEDLRDYPCISCGKQFEKLELYVKHAKLDHALNGISVLQEYIDKEVKCAKCGDVLPNMEELRTHCEIHKDGYFQCKECGKVMKGNSSLSRHMRAMHKIDLPTRRFNPKTQCPVCHKVMLKKTYKAHFFLHIKSVSEIPDGWAYFQCDACGKLFSMQNTLNEHIMRFHSGNVKSFMCELCAKSFKTNRDMKRHLATAHGGLEFPCKTCGKIFNTKIALKVHQIVHSDAMPFQCKKCDQVFRTKGSFTYHQRMHLFEKTCVICNKVIRQHMYKRHMEIHANSSIVIQCEDCGEIFGSQAHADEHKKSVHGGKTFECQYCDKVYKTRKVLRNHEKLHTGEGVHTCTICDKMFSLPSKLRDHFRIHTGERTFPCKLCDKFFSSSANRNAHERNCFLKREGIKVNVTYNPEFVQQMEEDTVANAVKSIADQFQQYEIETSVQSSQVVHSGQDADGYVHSAQSSVHSAHNSPHQGLQEGNSTNDTVEEIQFEILPDLATDDSQQSSQNNLTEITVETLAGNEEVM